MSILVGDTVRIRVGFYGNPISVTYEIYIASASPTTVQSGSATQETGFYWYVDWTPTEAGEFIIEFTATYEDMSQYEVSEELTVESFEGATPSTETLGTDYVLTFAGILEPLCVNPDELMPVFPDATELDVAEAIWRASLDTIQMLSLVENTCPTNYNVLDYIKAAAACELSKVFEVGDGNEQSIMLGDFSVTYRSYPKSSVNRGTATTWCELAAALRKEILYRASGAKAFVHGSNFYNPIPVRKLRREDERDIFEPHYQGVLDDASFEYPKPLGLPDAERP